MDMTRVKWSDARREAFYSELYALLTAGLDFSCAFQLLIDEASDTREKTLLNRLYREVVSGASLWQSMEHSGAFRRLECGVIRIGEETGRLSETLEFLGDYFRKRASQRKMIFSAVSYPIIILVIAVAVVVFMLAVVVPMFADVYMRMGSELPMLTQRIVSLARVFPSYAVIMLIAGCGIGFLWYVNRNQPRVQAVLAALWLRIPLVGTVIRKSYEMQICRLLHLLTSSGISLLAAVGMLREVVEFWPYKQSFVHIARMLERGDAFSKGLSDFSHLYDRKLFALVHVGEETGRLSDMLRQRAEILTSELEHVVHRMGALLEPLLIFFVGIFVAVILIAMYLPMFSLGGIMG